MSKNQTEFGHMIGVYQKNFFFTKNAGSTFNNPVILQNIQNLYK